MVLSQALSFPALLLVILALAGCGGPDGDKLLGEAKVQFDTAQQALAKGDWAGVRSGRSKGCAICDRAPEAESGGRTLAQHKAAAVAALGKAMAEAMPRLEEAAGKDRAAFATIGTLVEECAATEQRASWQESISPRVLQKLEAEELAAKAAAEEAERRKRQTSYVLVIDGGSQAKEMAGWKASIKKQLDATFAPAGVVLFETRPSERIGLGLIDVRIDWMTVGFGQSMGGFGASHAEHEVPASMVMTVTIHTYRKRSNLDGLRVFTFSEPIPGRINSSELAQLSGSCRGTMLAKAGKGLAALPALVEGEALLAAVTEPLPSPPTIIWSYTVSAHSTADVKERGMESHDFTDLGVAFAAALQERFPEVKLVPARPGGTAVHGKVQIAIETVEKRYAWSAQSGGMGGTIPEAAPATMKATITLSPEAGTVKKMNWAKTRTFSATAPLPDNKSVAFEAVLQHQAAVLAAQICEAIAAEPLLQLQ